MVCVHTAGLQEYEGPTICSYHFEETTCVFYVTTGNLTDEEIFEAIENSPDIDDEVFLLRPCAPALRALKVYQT